MSQRNIFASTRIGNFDDARRSNADANAASIVAHDVRGAARGVAQIDRNILRHVIGELTDGRTSH